MGRTNALRAAFNRGEVSKLALGRLDVEKLQLAAETMVNWVPTMLGPMQFRPGTAFVGGIANDATSVTIPFVYSVNDTALIELTPNLMRVLVDDVPVMRAAVASSFPGGAMTNPSQWTTTTTDGASATIGGGLLQIQNDAIGGLVNTYAAVSVGSPNVEHALRLSITQGSVVLRIGSAPHGNDILADTGLDAGAHSIAFTPPGGTAYVEFEVSAVMRAVIAGAPLESAGELRLPTPWSADLLPLLRWDQSADVVFVASGQRPQRIERRLRRSWSVVGYRTDDGPFQSTTPAQTTLSITENGSTAVITASRRTFQGSDVGRLIRAFTPDYGNTYTLSGPDAATPAVRISGLTAFRNLGLFVQNNGVNAWILERSITGEDTGFVQATDPMSTPANQPVGSIGNQAPYTYNDKLDNLIAWYRVRIKGFNGGSIRAQLTYFGGGRTGLYRIVSVDSPTQVTAQVITSGSSSNSTSNWTFGEWSDSTLWPTAVALYDGRLAFTGGDRLWLSVSDAFNSFADTLADGVTVGDSSAIARSIGYGPVAIMNWLLPLSRLLIGTLGSEVSVRSSALDAPLTPTGGLALKDCSTLGSARVPAVKCDTKGVFVQRSGQRLIALAYDVNSQDYAASDLNRLHPDLNLGNPIVRVAVQRQPNTRFHCVRQDGTVAVIVYEPGDEVQAWYRYDLPGGAVEDVAVLPDAIEDRVYYTVRRGTKRYRERFARLDEARGGALSKVADAHVAYTGAAIDTLSGLGHLEGQTVVVWADGQDRGTRVVSGGQITLTGPYLDPIGNQASGGPYANVCAGLFYDGTFKSAKLAYAAQGGTALNQKKRVIDLGLVLSDTHAQGIQYGCDPGLLDNLPLTENGADIDPAGGYASYDEAMFPVNGTYDTDARLYVNARAPRPATVVAASLTVETNG